MTQLGWIVLALPLLGSLILSLWPHEPSKTITRVVGCGSMLVAFGLTLTMWLKMLAESPEERVHTSSLWRWLESDGLTIELGIRIDQLSILMMLVITGIGFLIHAYSTEYMDHEPGYRRFFAQMNFFVFAMLLLVEAGNFFFLIVGWALVGLASYLLIGFYDDRPVAVAAARKAFVINVIGDIGMVLAAFILVDQLGTLDFGSVFAQADAGLGSGAAEAVALLLFVGAAAKSAQVPLHTWLPDAMEGPTPVSALIHAATMVTAGVYLIVRCHSLFEIAPTASDIVAVVGGITMLMAATIAIAQVDIKRVLAWSTVSQIGYMIMGAGLGAYAGSMFHFLTHAFFKALLFLGAGMVIHALAGEQSLDKMGGLAKHLRPTMIVMAIGCMAIAGVPGLAGFFSKDAILAHAWEAGSLGKVLWIAGIVTAALTAFYMFRLFFRTFSGAEPAGGHHHVHAPGRVMFVPVALLAIGSVVIGWIELPGGAWLAITDWLEPLFADVADPLHPTHASEWITGIASTIVAGLGIGLAWWIFVADPSRRERLAARFGGVRGTLEDAYRFDAIYDGAVVESTKSLGDTLRTTGEKVTSQGLVTAATEVTRSASGLLRGAQTGIVRTYAGALMGGVALVGLIFVLVSR